MTVHGTVGSPLVGKTISFNHGPRPSPEPVLTAHLGTESAPQPGPRRWRWRYWSRRALSWCRACPAADGGKAGVPGSPPLPQKQEACKRATQLGALGFKVSRRSGASCQSPRWTCCLSLSLPSQAGGERTGQRSAFLPPPHPGY